jgi:hypothetical protein
MRAVTPHSCREVVPSCWTNGTAAKTGLVVDEFKRRMSASAWSLGMGKVERAEGRSMRGYGRGMRGRREGESETDMI